MKRMAESGRSFSKNHHRTSGSECEGMNSQDVEEACQKAIASVLNKKSRINEKRSQTSKHISPTAGPLTPEKVSAACKRSLEAIAKNPAATSKGVRHTTEGKRLCKLWHYFNWCTPFIQNDSISGAPFTPKRIQGAVRTALQSVANNPLPSSNKGGK